MDAFIQVREVVPEYAVEGDRGNEQPLEGLPNLTRVANVSALGRPSAHQDVSVHRGRRQLKTTRTMDGSCIHSSTMAKICWREGVSFRKASSVREYTL